MPKFPYLDHVPDGTTEALLGPAAATSIGVGATGDRYVDGLLFGTKWSGTVSFSFPDARSDYPATYGSGEPDNGFAQVSFADMQAVRAILTGGSPLSGGNALLKNMGVTGFTHLSIADAGFNGADIRVGQSNTPSTAWAYYPGSYGEAGDVWLGTRYAGTIHDYRNPVLGNYAYHTLVHELGHALGLKHSQDVGGVANTAVPADRDSIEFTVMSYRSYVGSPTNGYTYEQWGAPQSYMMLDIAALQTLYGADYSLNSGNTVYSWSPTTGQMSINGAGQGTPGGNRIFLTIWDGGGFDTYDLSNYTNAINIDLAPGGWSVASPSQLAYLGNGHYAHGNIFNAMLYGNNAASIIEAAKGGSGNDTIKGNPVNNALAGNAGQDSLDGQAGNDTLDGGLGNDTLLGGTGDDSLLGGDGLDSLVGADGSDLLDGGTGADSLIGGAGNDTYVVDSTGDRITELSGGGTDTVRSSISTTLGAELEHLTLTGSAGINGTGNSGNNFIIGNTAANLLAGGLGNDTLVGAAGTDTLTGGGGLDAFLFTGPGDRMDVITDFIARDDTLEFSAAGFGHGLVAGMNLSAAGRLHISSSGAATGSLAQFTYSTSTKLLSWDVNGSASGGVTQLATLQGASGVTASDFVVIA